MTVFDTVFKLFKFYRIAFFSFLMLFLSVGLNAQTCCNYPGWTYKTPITIDNNSNSNTLSDYQFLFMLDTQNPILLGRMKADGSDIRFKDENCNDLFYWIESGINTDTTKVWVKLLSVPANSSVVVTMFFGNPTAVAESNGDLTFIFFDGFDSTSVDLSKWSINGSPTISFNAGYISIASNVNTQMEGLYATKILDNVILEAEIMGTFQSGVNAGGGQVFGFSDDPTVGTTGYSSWRNYFFFYPPDGDFMHRLYQNPGSPNTLNFPFNGMSKWSRYRITWTATYADASLDGSKQALSLTYNPGYVVLYDYHTEEIHCDYVFARSYTNLVPSITYGGQTATGNSLATSIMVTDVLCNGDSTGIIEVSDSIGGALIYTWTPNVSTDSIATGLSAGLYVVSVTDTSSGCSSTDSVTITEPTAINVVLTTTDITCQGVSEGMVVATVSGGLGPYAYLWSPSSGSGSSIDSLSEGTYSVIVTDSNGCSVTDSALVLELSSGPVTSAIVGDNNVNPFSSHGYSVTNTPGSTYGWSVIGGTQTFGGSTDSIQVLWDSAGTGQVMLVEMDSLGCIGDTVFLSITISVPAGVEAFSLSNFSLYPNPGKGILTVEFEVSETKDVVLALISMEGKMINTFMEKKVSGKFKEKLDLQSYSKGMYQLQISVDGELINRKIIVQ